MKVCGRTLVGSGADSYDPTCELLAGHPPPCMSTSAIDQHRLALADVPAADDVDAGGPLGSSASDDLLAVSRFDCETRDDGRLLILIRVSVGTLRIPIRDDHARAFERAIGRELSKRARR